MYVKSNKRRRQAEATRKRIHECALDLFAKKGFDNVTVEEVAAAAGVSVGAFYHHFRSKQSVMAVYYETLDERYLEYRDTVMETPEFAAMTALDKLEALNLYVIEMCVREGVEYVRIVYPYMMTNAEFAATMTNRKRPHGRIIREILAEGQKNGEIPLTLDQDRVVGDILIICRGCIVDWCMHNGEIDIHDHSRSVLRHYLEGIAAG